MTNLTNVALNLGNNEKLGRQLALGLSQRNKKIYRGIHASVYFIFLIQQKTFLANPPYKERFVLITI
jgi:hypothetical protein